MKAKTILTMILILSTCIPVFAKGKKHCVGVNRPEPFKNAGVGGSEENTYCYEYFREQMRLSQQIQIERLKGTLARLKRENAKKGININLNDEELDRLIKIEQKKLAFMIKLQQIRGSK